METIDRLNKHMGEEPLYGPDVFVAPTARSYWRCANG